nr:MAG TPA: hypothetical protein [Caudoviricetes sp.]
MIIVLKVRIQKKQWSRPLKITQAARTLGGRTEDST